MRLASDETFSSVGCVCANGAVSSVVLTMSPSEKLRSHDDAPALLFTGGRVVSSARLCALDEEGAGRPGRNGVGVLG